MKKRSEGRLPAAGRTPVLILAVLLLAGCANSDYRFEQVDGGRTVSIPLKFESLDGTRDGDSVTAEARFSNGRDSAQMHIHLRLVPPAEFVSGTYQITLNGKTMTGTIDCLSLDYQGGQGSVTLPSTPIRRR
jgi:hypothetical protein